MNHQSTTNKPNKIRITRKITLIIDSEDKSEIKKSFDQLYGWQKVAFKASNIIVAHLYCQEQLKEFSYFKDEVPIRLNKSTSENNGVLNTSRENCTYRLISNKFKTELPTAIIACLNHNIYSNFTKGIFLYPSQRELFMA